MPSGIGDAVLRGRDAEGELGAEDRPHAERAGRLGEPDDAVEPVVVGERERLEPEPGRLLGELLRLARAVEEAERGVGVQLGVRDGARRRRRTVGGS